jgi:hypothetical protein
VAAKKDKFDILMEYNDSFHKFMAKLAESKVDDDAAYVSKELMNTIVDYTNSATAYLDTPELKVYHDQFIEWGKAPTKVLAVLDTGDDFIVMPKAVWIDLQDPILNNMSNLVHNAAAATVQATKQLKACSIGSFKPDDSLAISKYCSGAKPGSILVQQVPLQKKNIGGKTWIKQYPSSIKHTLGCHSVMPSFSTSDEIASAIEYHDSYLNHQGSANRLRGVKERLEMMGFKCNIGGVENGKYKKHKDIFCNTSDIKPDDIRTLGSYFSILLDGDIHIPDSDPEAYQVVRDKAWEYAAEKTAKYGDDTWQSPNYHKPDWSQLYNEWKEEKQYKKNAIYNELRELLILRDIHHMIEEKYGIDQGKANLSAMKQIVANATKMQAIMAKNGWGNIVGSIKKIQDYIDKGVATNIAVPSDNIGHVSHMVVVNKLSKAGQYGGCSMGGNIININTGNLAYCEGVLQNTQGNVIDGTGGNGWYHKITPTILKTAVDEDDFDAFQYAFKISLPENKQLADSVKSYLTTNGFNCSSNMCKIATKDLDEIRQMALFMSNLKGADGNIGEDCAKKAVESALTTAKEQNKKGVFAFTQSPLHSNPKEWIDMCFKQHGIAPPNMTEEDKKILQIIGADKIYGGCSFAYSDILPNIGYVKYCEGVRKNPQESINARLTPSGSLDHYYHGDVDKIANISITPLDKGYDVFVSNIDMRDKKDGKPLQKAVVKRLKSLGFQCTGITSCSTQEPMDENQVRTLAAYLSSMHHAYNTSPECIPLAEQYAWDKAKTLPQSIEAHDSMVYPFKVEQWNKEVCSKVTGTAEAATEAKVEDESSPAPQKWYYGTPTKIINEVKGKKAPFTVGGCISQTSKKPTIAVATFCSGVQKYSKDDNGDVKLDWAAGLKPGINLMYIQKTGNIVFDNQLKSIVITLPENLMHPGIIKYLNLKGFVQKGNTFGEISYKPVIFKVAKFFSYLHNFAILNEQCKVKAIEHAKQEADKLTYDEIVEPYTKKQWDAFCETSEPEVKKGPTLPQAKEAILEYITSNKPVSFTITGAAKVVAKKHNVDAGLSLTPVEMILDELVSKGELTTADNIIYTAAETKTIPGKQKVKDEIVSLFKSSEWLYASSSFINDWLVDKAFVPKHQEGAVDALLQEMVSEGLLQVKPPGTGSKIYYSYTEQPSDSIDLQIAIDKAKKEWEQAEEPANKVKDKCKDADAYKKLPIDCKKLIHAYMAYHLLYGFQKGWTDEHILQEAQKSIINTFPKLTPLMVKLQLDIEKKNQICLGNLPAEPGKTKAQACEVVSEAEAETKEVPITDKPPHIPIDMWEPWNSYVHNYPDEVTDCWNKKVAEITGSPYHLWQPNTTDAEPFTFDNKQALINAWKVCVIEHYSSKESNLSQIKTAIQSVLNTEPMDGDMLVEVVKQKLSPYAVDANDINEAVEALSDLGVVFFKDGLWQLTLATSKKTTYEEFALEFLEKNKGGIYNATEISDFYYQQVEPSSQLESPAGVIVMGETLDKLAKEGKIIKEGKTPVYFGYKHPKKGKKSGYPQMEQLKKNILKAMNETKAWYTAEELIHIPLLEGKMKPITSSEVEDALEELTQEGSVQWNITSKPPAYKINENGKYIVEQLLSEPKYFNDLSDDEIVSMQNQAITKAKAGKNKKDIIEEIALIYGLSDMDDGVWKVAEAAMEHVAKQEKEVKQFEDNIIEYLKENGTTYPSKIIEYFDIPFDDLPHFNIAMQNLENADKIIMSDAGLKLIDKQAEEYDSGLISETKNLIVSYLEDKGAAHTSEIYIGLGATTQEAKNLLASVINKLQDEQVIEFDDDGYYLITEAEAEEEVEEEEWTFENQTPETQAEIINSIKSWAKYYLDNGESNVYELVVEKQKDLWGYEKVAALDDLIKSTIFEVELGATSKEEKPEFSLYTSYYYEDLPESKKAEIDEFAKSLAKEGGTVSNMIESAMEHAGLEFSKPLKNAMEEIWQEYSPDVEDEAEDKTFESLDIEQQAGLVDYLNDIAGEYDEETLQDKLCHDYDIVPSDGLSIEIMEAIQKAAKEEESPTVMETLVEESMADFIKMGMSAEGVTKIFGEQYKKYADKLWKLYHTDEAVMTTSLYSLPEWAQVKAKNAAQGMLDSGKTQEDTIWYISYHMNLTKESVEHMVKALAKIPISETEQLLAAFKTLGIGEELGGCKVKSDTLGNLTGQTVSYCQGVLSPIGKEAEAEIKGAGTSVYHDGEHQGTVVNTEINDKTWSTRLTYGRDGEGQNIAETVARTLREWGFNCEEHPQTHNLSCHYRGSDGHTMSIEDQDSLRRTAVFLSSIDNVALLPPSCIPAAMEYAKNHAVGIAKTSKPWTVNVFPHSIEDWNNLVCKKVK